MSLDVTLSGDSLVTGRISACEDPRFLEFVEFVRDADVGYTHLEIPIHDFEGPELYPAAEAGGAWMRSPPYVADDLSWAGFDLVSTASNHALDYSYGGLFATWDALEAAGIPHAGTGANLGEARSPTYLDTAAGRLALVSMTTSFTRWGRSGDARSDLHGRPGVNPLRYHQVVTPERLETVKDAMIEFGWWVIPLDDDAWEFTPPGCHSTAYHVFVEEDPESTTVVHDHDRRGNLRAIEEAANNADFVLAHVHAHDWKGGEDKSVPPDFLAPFARECVDAGADVFLSQGSHQLRGVEVYGGKPIFYDVGDLFVRVRFTRQPADFYARYSHRLDVHEADATPSIAVDAGMTSGYTAVNPPGVKWDEGSSGFLLPRCIFDDGGGLRRVELHPGHHIGDGPDEGLPRLATDDEGRDTLDQVARLSEPHGTAISIEDGIGVLEV